VDPAPDVTESNVGAANAIAVLKLSGTTGPSGSVNPQVQFHSATTGSFVGSAQFFTESNQAWQPIAIDTISDGNSDGTSGDFATVMLAENLVTGQIKVQIKAEADGSKLRTNIPFFNANWTAIDVAALNDLNGDGTEGDTGIAVLAQHKANGYYEVRVTPFDTVNNLPILQQRVFSSAWDVKAVEGIVAPGGGDSMLSVLGTDAGGKSKVQNRLVSDGSLYNSIFGWGPEVDATDIAVGYELPNVPVVALYGNRDSNGNSVLRVRLISTGQNLDSYGFLSGPYETGRITATGDYIAGSATDQGDGSIFIKVRLDSGEPLSEIFP
jgi:hypothetical protein